MQTVSRYMWQEVLPLVSRICRLSQRPQMAKSLNNDVQPRQSIRYEKWYVYQHSQPVRKLMREFNRSVEVCVADVEEAPSERWGEVVGHHDGEEVHCRETHEYESCYAPKQSFGARRKCKMPCDKVDAKVCEDEEGAVDDVALDEASGRDSADVG
jgi:hypothetical protein